MNLIKTILISASLISISHLSYASDVEDLEKIKKIPGVKCVEAYGEGKLLVEMAKQNFSRTISSDISKTIINVPSWVFIISTTDQNSSFLAEFVKE